VQWDGWVLDGTAAAGIPQVGNGGFSLRSVSLGRYLAGHADEFPLVDPRGLRAVPAVPAKLADKGFSLGHGRGGQPIRFGASQAGR
jgi:hypothetical protein